jgi:hypothetical protein
MQLDFQVMVLDTAIQRQSIKGNKLKLCMLTRMPNIPEKNIKKVLLAKKT